jgi:hypothetical protein
VRRRLHLALVAMLSVAMLLAVACDEDEAAPPPPSSDAPAASVAPAAETPRASEAPAASTAPAPAGGALDEVPLRDAALIRGDIDCSLEFVASGGGEEFPDAFTSAHFVVDGILGATCLGADDERLIDAWRWLRVTAPAEALEALILFAGFDADSDTLAYVEPLSGPDGRLRYQMTVNLRQAAEDEAELMLTMAHEFTHIFAATESQLDEDVWPEDCETFHNGDGCFLADSFIGRWVAAFWGDWIADLDPDNIDDPDAADARCWVDDSFLGAYAATNPEEDFAETFSAFVYSVPVETPGLLAKYEFLAADPSLRVYRDRVQALGYGPLPNQFGGCG